MLVESTHQGSVFHDRRPVDIELVVEIGVCPQTLNLSVSFRHISELVSVLRNWHGQVNKVERHSQEASETL